MFIKAQDLQARIQDVIKIIEAGGLVVYPTDTLYGLGCDPFNKKAMASLFQAKKRPEGMPVSIAVHSISKICDISKIIFTSNS